MLLASCGGGGETSNTNNTPAPAKKETPTTPANFEISWKEFPSQAVLGRTTAVLPDPLVTPTPDTLTISVKSGGCAWDSSQRTLTFNELGICVVSVLAQKEGLEEKSRDFSVGVVGEFTSISWNDFPSAAQVNTSTDPLGDPVVVPSPDEIEITHKSGACAWDTQTKVLSFSGGGDCIISVTARKPGFAEKVRDFSVNPSLQPITLRRLGSI